MLKEYLGKKLLEPRATPFREIFVSRINGAAPDMAAHFEDTMLAMWEQDGITEILFEEPHGEDVQCFVNTYYPDAWFEGETGVPYSDWETGEPVRMVRVAGFLIQYSWEPPVAPGPGHMRLVLDPGLAFGTGRHPSTRQSLALLHKAFAENPSAAVLDLGCGSGVLSVAAAALHANVRAVDYSLVAAHATAINTRLNHLEDRVHVVHGDAFDNLHHAAGLVLCNLNHTLNRKLLSQSQFLQASRVLLSGIHGQERFAEITGAAEAAGLQVSATEQEGPWFSFLCQRWG